MSTILKLCQEIPVRTIEPGTILLSEGTKDGAICVLASGEVEILKGEFQVNCVGEPGAVFGEMSLLLDTPHTATVRARSACRVHVIEDGEAFLRSNTDVAYDLLKIVAGRLRGVNNYLTDLNRYIHAM